jgi:uncharacterized protein (TIGR02217 family)
MASHVAHRLSAPIELGAKRVVRMDLTVTPMDGGTEARERRWDQFLFDFEVSFPVGKRAGNTNLDEVTAAFLATGGGELSFDLRDYRESSVTDEAFGVGDGSTKVFPLTRTYAFGPVSHVRRIYRPVSPITVKKAGIVQSSGYTVDYQLGVVTFTAAPAAAAVLSWSGDFNVPVRFDREQISQAVSIHNEHIETLTLYGVRLSAADFA